jgi:hypothetical protein
LLDDYVKGLPDALSQENDRMADLFRKSDELASTFGEMMFELCFEPMGEYSRVLSLKVRQKPFHWNEQEQKDVDLVAHLGYQVLENEVFGALRAYDYGNMPEDPKLVGFNEELRFRRNPLVDALLALFKKVRTYENIHLKCEWANNGHGIDRKAHVSITNMGVLHGFDAPELQELPEIYHTFDQGSEEIILPSYSNGKPAIVPPLEKMV